MTILKAGMAGEPVKLLQEKLGVTVDGQFGPATEKALREYQAKEKIAVDGVAGPDTFTHMGLPQLVLLTVGSVGETVKKLQTELGITADGRYGPATANAVKEFQKKNGIPADGVAGPLTLSKTKMFAKEMTPNVIAGSILDFGTKAARSIWDTITGVFTKK
ncbi:MAG: peptidoglycan-binding protein [Xanthobacteraceae bacterium]|nr:peptidoglycan-binding protein [Xanthobacteraceae bacterium]QYK44413.1 MAG: peptidoglycan-binding protein [Xanthobacteraceae bacterium]HMN51032.1 peptidoglycan-binding protein [Xanthobacteraceae bacterium]